MASAPEHRKRNTFTSYISPMTGAISNTNTEFYDDWCLLTETREGNLVKPRMLPSELIVASAPAYLYPAIAAMESSNLSAEEDKEAVFGLLTVTNFKLAFVPFQRPQLQKALSSNPSMFTCSQEHLHLQYNDVTLNNIDYIIQIAEAGRAASALPGNAGKRKKRLDAQHKLISGRITALHIMCKNFRLLKFAFQQTNTGRDWGKFIASALARFAFTSRHDLSFAYRYQEPYYPTMSKTGVSMYATKNDWARELIRCGCNNWQVISSENSIFKGERKSIKHTLPPHFVIPKACTVERFLELSQSFCDSRAAFWVYSYGSASLVRLAELTASVQQDTTVENVMLEMVRGCNERKMLHLLQLTDRLPNIQDVQRAYQKLRRLCAPESPQIFLVEDRKFLTLLEKSNWLFYVSLSLRYSCEAADSLKAGTTCVLQETNGRDMCCVVSSLTQIILDPLYRTINGFQSLVQKEWIALEHPFQRRLGQIRQPIDSNTPDEESPVFLLFLDCVWQLLQQYPEEFEFSQTYLTTLWDSCFMPLFDTFQFDCNADRLKAVEEYHLVLRPVWDWGEQFSEKDKVFFNNPFYQRQRQEMPAFRRSVAIPAGAIMLPGLAKPLQSQQRVTLNPQKLINQSSILKDRYLEPQYHMADLAIWEQCYYRWMPILEIPHGGYPQIDLYHRLLLANISKLQRCIELQDYSDLPDVYYEMTDESKPLVQQNKVESTADLHGVGNELIDGVERRRKSFSDTTIANSETLIESSTTLLREISSFFPFSSHTNEAQQRQLHDILTSSNEYLLEGGSIMDHSSIV